MLIMSNLGTGPMDLTLNLPNLKTKSPPFPMVKETVLPGGKTANGLIDSVIENLPIFARNKCKSTSTQLKLTPCLHLSLLCQLSILLALNAIHGQP
jgi:hypothetical protein